MASVLEQAGVRQARAVIVTTSDDLTNLDAAITARELNRDAKIVIRLFDETLATKVAGAFADADDLDVAGGRPGVHRRGDRAEDLPGISARRPVRPLHGHRRSAPTGRLVGRTVGEIQSDKRINIVMHQGATGGVNVNPDAEIVLEPGDTILVIAPMEALLTLETMNHSPACPPSEGRGARGGGRGSGEEAGRESPVAPRP